MSAVEFMLITIVIAFNPSMTLKKLWTGYLKLASHSFLKADF